MTTPLRPESAALFQRIQDVAYDDDGDDIAWQALEALQSSDDPAIFAEAARLLRSDRPPPNAQFLVHLVRYLGGPELDALLRDCAASPNILVAGTALRWVAPTELAAHAPVLLTWLHGDIESLQRAALRGIGQSGDARLLEAAKNYFTALPDDARARRVLDLAHGGISEIAPIVAALLPSQTGRVHAAFCGALELMKNRAAVPALVDQLRTAPDAQLWDLAHALRLITGADPLDDSDGGDNDAPARVRARWLEAHARGHLDHLPDPHFSRIEIIDEDLATFDIAWGRGAIEVDYKPPIAGATWPRWDRALTIAGKRIYDTGSTCGTCETVLHRVGWPDDTLASTARALDAAGFGRTRLDREWIESMSPLLFQLRSGRYLVGLVDLYLDRIDPASADKSFFVTRNDRRNEHVERDEDGLPSDWPGTSHYQTVTDFADGQLAIYTVVMPTRDPTSLDEARVERFAAPLLAGERPWALALGYVDDRYVRARWEERFFSLILLDGHHRVEAAVRYGESARIAVLFRLADNWGPPEERDRHIRRALTYYPPFRLP